MAQTPPGRFTAPPQRAKAAPQRPASTPAKAPAPTATVPPADTAATRPSKHVFPPPPKVAVGQAIRTQAAPATADEAGKVIASTSFFGRTSQGRRFAFILDMSGSMQGQRWARCTRELGAALAALPPTAEFVLVLFSQGLLEPPGGGGWTPALPERVATTLAWVDTVQPAGGTYPQPAFKRVFSLGARPDVVYFLTDGELSGFTPRDCARMRRRKGGLLHWLFSKPDPDARETVINTVALGNDIDSAALQSMAAEAGGAFVQVP